jgi:hypothetical protein
MRNYAGTTPLVRRLAPKGVKIVGALNSKA